jgi:hypothetical protein
MHNLVCLEREIECREWVRDEAQGQRENGVGEGGVNRRGEIEKGMEGGNDIEKKRVGEAVLFP